jgi:hypothetical protein
MGGIGAGLDPGGGSRGASLGVWESVPCHPFPLAGWASAVALPLALPMVRLQTPNFQPDRSPFAVRAIASHSDATNNIVRRASWSFMSSALARASAALAPTRAASTS